MSKNRYQKRHYYDIAELLHGERECVIEVGIIDQVARKLCDLFAADNDNFNPDRFLMVVINGNLSGKAIAGGPAMPFYENAVDYSMGKPHAPHKGRRHN